QGGRSLTGHQRIANVAARAAGHGGNTRPADEQQRAVAAEVKTAGIAEHAVGAGYRAATPNDRRGTAGAQDSASAVGVQEHKRAPAGGIGAELDRDASVVHVGL